MLWVHGDSHGLRLEALLLQEVGHAGALLARHCGQHVVGRVKVPPHDRRLVLEHGEQDGVADNVELLVAQVEAVVLGDVAEEVHDAVQMGDGHDLTAHVVVEAVDAVCVDETVTNPAAGLDSLFDFSYHLLRQGFFSLFFILFANKIHCTSL